LVEIPVLTSEQEEVLRNRTVASADERNTIGCPAAARVSYAVNIAELKLQYECVIRVKRLTTIQKLWLNAMR
jgi:hypothetical protein